MKFKKLKETREKREPQKTCTNISKEIQETCINNSKTI